MPDGNLGATECCLDVMDLMLKEYLGVAAPAATFPGPPQPAGLDPCTGELSMRPAMSDGRKHSETVRQLLRIAPAVNLLECHERHVSGSTGCARASLH